MRSAMKKMFLHKVLPPIETPAWEHALFLMLFITTSGGV
jgi:hypothetical protein